jgi:hypothetical protein
MRNNVKVVVVEKLVNTSRQMRRSVVVIKRAQMQTFWAVFHAMLEETS